MANRPIKKWRAGNLEVAIRKNDISKVLVLLNKAQEELLLTESQKGEELK